MSYCLTSYIPPIPTPLSDGTYMQHSLYLWEVLVGREELKWCQPVHHQLWSPQGPHFSAQYS